MFGACKVALFSIFALRLAKLQLFSDGSYKKMSFENRTRKIIITPKRGVIKDRNGLDIATNTQYYRLIFNPSKYERDAREIGRLAQILGLDEKVERQMLKRYKTARGVPFVIYKYLARKELVKFSANEVYFPSIFVEKAFLRIYSNPFAYSSFVGYVSESDKDTKDLIKNSDIKVGKSGIEKIYNNSLLGIPGVKIVEVDSKARIVNTSILSTAVDGAELKLALDAKVQEFTYNLIKDKAASVVLIHIPTNSVMACVSAPTFNSNSLSKQITASEWNDLQSNPYKPLLNRAFSALYPPGSIFKIIVALANLDAGLSPTHEEHCPGYFTYGGRRFHCWKNEGHGRVNMFQAIKQSCNVYFYKSIRNLDIERVSQIAQDLGLGAKPYDDILKQMNYEQGIIPSPKWKRRRYRELWQGGDSINFGIGQGYSLINCFQIAVMISRVASGKLTKPSFILNNNQGELSNLKLPEQYFEIIRKGMFMATNEAGGTSYMSRLGIDGFEMCGKTGSAQAVSRYIDNHAKRTENESTHALFAGFAPYINPQYAIAVVNEHGGFGAAAAAPIAKQILQFIASQQT